MIRLSGNREILSLARVLRNDREALLQLLMSLRKEETLNRIVKCPTYPVATETPDLKERLELFRRGIEADRYLISRALAMLYEYATDEEHRKVHGQYFTPNEVAEEAVRLLELRPSDTILDPGCGTGIFPLKILEQSSGDADHPEYLGVENDPILALSTAISLDWVDAPRGWRVLYDNFLRVERRHLNDVKCKNVNVIIANPPFVRSHRLSDKSRLADRLGLSEFSGLHSFFLAHSSRLLTDGRMAFILPLEMKDTHYGSNILRRLRSRFAMTVKGIYYRKSDSTWYVTDPSPRKHMQQMMTLALFRSHPEVRKYSAVSALTNGRKEGGAVVPLSSLASVHRGISTGANVFFVITDESAKKIEVPISCLKKVVPTRIQLPPSIFTEKVWEEYRRKGKACWLLALPTVTPFEELPPGVRQYIKEGESQGIHLIPTCRNRKVWYSVRIPRIPDLIFTYISREYPRFIYNEARVYALTNLLGVYLKISVEQEKMNELARFLTNTLRDWMASESVGRRYSGGLIKFEPGDLLGMPVSKPTLDRLKISTPSLDTHLKH